MAKVAKYEVVIGRLNNFSENPGCCSALQVSMHMSVVALTAIATFVASASHNLVMVTVFVQLGSFVGLVQISESKNLENFYWWCFRKSLY